MTIGLMGIKCGMTRIYDADGKGTAVTVLHVDPNLVTQVKTQENDGYDAIQVTTRSIKRSKLTKPAAGHFAKAGVEPGFKLLEFRLDKASVESGKFQVGTALTVTEFAEGQYVDVSGVTKGKGYAGAVKRHHFRTQDNSHGNSVSHRAPGSIGQRQSPGKVFKNKRMSGHMGDVKRTILSQQIMRVDAERNLILVKGAVPGASNGFVVIRPAVKKSAKSA